MSRESKIKEEIIFRERELKVLREKLEVARLRDWKEKEGKYWLVETFPYQGKTDFSIYHIIKVAIDYFECEYVELTNKYIFCNKFNFLIKPFCMKWTETTKKEFDKQCKGCEDLRKEKR